MKPRAFLDFSKLTLADLLEKLKQCAEPGELDDLSISTISRHVRGNYFPSARLQDLYRMATDGAVLPQDWVDLARARRADERDEPERASA